MKSCSIKNFLYIYIFIYIYNKNQIKGEDCCKLCCCCYLDNKKKNINLNNFIQNNINNDNNQIENFGGIKGIIGKLEDNKVTFNVNTDSGLRKIAETVEEYNGDFNYENVKNLKMKLLDIEVAPETIEKQIESFDCSNTLTNSFSFLKNKTKVVTYTKEDLSEFFVYNLNDNRVYISKYSLYAGGYILINLDKTFKELKYGVTEKGIYVKRTDDRSWSFDCDKDKQEEYKKCFLEGK